MPQTFPSFLPGPSRSFGVKRVGATIVNQMASGRFRQRRLYPDNRREASVQWEFSQIEFNLFQSWFEHFLKDGSLNFNISLSLDEAEPSTYSAYFIDGVFSATHFGVGFYRVTAKLLLETAAYTSEGDFTTLADFFDELGAPVSSLGGITNLASILESLVNDEIPDIYTIGGGEGDFTDEEMTQIIALAEDVEQAVNVDIYDPSLNTIIEDINA